MAVRNDFAPGEVLAAADLNDTFGSKLDVAGGKILQIVRATDSSERTTTSTSFVDVTGMSVSITPQKNDSAIIIIATGHCRTQWTSGDGGFGVLQITDSSNNAISGVESSAVGTDELTGTGTRRVNDVFTVIAYNTPSTIMSVSYKLRFRTAFAAATFAIRNSQSTGQMYAIEVSA
jgi:hypothetical protein